MTWYVIQTNPKCERKAMGNLRRLGVRVYMPSHTVEKRRRGFPALVKPLFIGYLVVRFPDAMLDRHGVPPWRTILETCGGVRRVLNWWTPHGIEPMPVSDRIIERYMHRQRAGDYDGAKQAMSARTARRAALRPGTVARIEEGPFGGWLGRVETVDGDVARLLVDIFGRETPISMDCYDERLTPVANEPVTV